MESALEQDRFAGRADGLQEGDIVVARAGALLREGDPVRPVMASADAK